MSTGVGCVCPPPGDSPTQGRNSRLLRTEQTNPYAVTKAFFPSHSSRGYRKGVLPPDIQLPRGRGTFPLGCEETAPGSLGKARQRAHRKPIGDIQNSAGVQARSVGPRDGDHLGRENGTSHEQKHSAAAPRQTVSGRLPRKPGKP